MLKVLVVDDEMFVRKGLVMETDWKALGFVVAAEAENGLEALMASSKIPAGSDHLRYPYAENDRA